VRENAAFNHIVPQGVFFLVLAYVMQDSHIL